MEIEHRQYLDLHRPNYEMVQNGYVRNIDLDILKMYEHIYRKYMNPDFILTVWCSHCIFDMIKRLYEWYDLQPKPKKDNLKQMNGIESEASFVKTRKCK
jgi:hypothetical protein